MTSIKKIPSVLGARRGNTLDQERDQFERNQETSFRKAINDEEAPVKMKHVRSIIIGTHTEKSGILFWRQVSLTPPLHTDVSSWKFCHTLHLILRDGHPNVLRDSFSHIHRIKDLGSHFRHLPHGYGPLIWRYANLLVCKLTFHQHYPKLPGALSLNSEELDNIVENDPNNYFELAIEMIEYMECILKLYEAVFHSLDPSRANSMTKMGQCRLAPLIPCIQDSSCLYDFIVRLLFKLHKAVQVDMLFGHRTRFGEQFKLLHNFYNSTRNLQYFKGLIQVPHLPQDSPNFLVESELRSHVAPVVVVEEQPDIIDGAEALLVDTADSEPPPIPPHPDVVDDQNGSFMEVMAERESLIEALHHELEITRAEIQRVRSESSHMEDQYKLKVNDLESSIAELASELHAEKQSKESILAQVEAAAASAEAVTRLAQEETLRRTAEEKFYKIKDVYQKLREEHITLLRGKAEIEKCLETEREVLREERRKREDAESKLAMAKAQLHEQDTLQTSIQNTEKEMYELQKRLLEETRENEHLRVTLREIKQKIEEKEREVRSAEETTNYSLDKCLYSSIDGVLSMIDGALSHFEVASHSDVKSSAEYTLLKMDMLSTAAVSLKESYTRCLEDAAAIPQVIRSLEVFGHYMSSFLLYAKATSHISPDITVAESLISALVELGKHTATVMEAMRKKECVEEGLSHMESLLDKCGALVRDCRVSVPCEEDIASVVAREMEAMDAAICKAVEKFTLMLETSRETDTGMQLEVNEKILGTCGDLMAAVRLLVQRASELQKEIVLAGKGGGSPTEFYKRNHRWTEGLISGAKTVALACQALMSAADQVVSGRGKFEEVIVASREIAASSMQLVMASRVKADRSSQALANVNTVAKKISHLTGTVVATAESCRDKVIEANTLDFSKLSLHSAKRLEMETLVKVLETEKQLETERLKLAELRRHHYRLAGELEGWEETDMPK